MAEWGNGQDVRAGVDMQSPAGNFNLEVTDINAARSALKATNSNGNGLALEAIGKTKLDGDVEIDNGILNCREEVHVFDQLFAESAALIVGTLTCESGVSVDGNLTVGPSDAAGNINSGSVPATPRDLNIGTQTRTDDVVIGRAGKNVEVNSAKLDVDGDLKVGPTDASGKIDSGGSIVTPRSLLIGSGAETSNVVISHDDGDVAIPAPMTVGSSDDAGMIDSGGSSLTPRSLKIGTQDVTDNVELSRSGKTIDMKGQARMNGKAIILNDASSITDEGARGIIDNSTGQGSGGASIDFYINGQCVFYINSTGGHDV